MISGALSTPLQGSNANMSPVVYILDDDESMRNALGALLRSVDLRAETFASPKEFLAFPKYAGPSCLILDVRLRGESGLTFHQEIAKSGLQIPVLFITGHGDIEMSVRAMKAGARDFFPKPFRDQDMLDAVAEALKYDVERISAEQSLAAVRSAYESLTPRERDVLGYVLAGLMNKQIASEMELSEITVKIHRGQMMKKMESRSVAELVRKAEAIHIAPSHPKAH
ncbi:MULTISPECIES: response regulator transcription factor [Paraburkholderia]|jgi:FixJ family two-component response regulator|uniref:Two component transcriptional regulator, LuxR family n=1 Tax=Paraburkholderia phenazinium TaxID=60549 RepID=A0A1N6KCH1_9BURK|nr:response regulator [Paraburkholderia phenazinium]SIO54265.1 two component transcriptional regulator, LuxR family [Paraburkholderia phenazinium]